MEYKEHAFTVHGREIRFSRAQDIYNAIEQQFWPRYNETVKDFDRFYSSNISSFEELSISAWGSGQPHTEPCDIVRGHSAECWRSVLYAGELLRGVRKRTDLRTLHEGAVRDTGAD